jgi:hypothetical protein
MAKKKTSGKRGVSREETCPFCGKDAVAVRVGFRDRDRVEVGRCGDCRRLIVRVNGEVVYPSDDPMWGELPGLPKELSGACCEAVRAARVSPRASCAILLPCLERICDQLGAEGSTLGEKVLDLRKKRKIPEEFAGLFHAPIPKTDDERRDAARQQAYDLGNLAFHLGGQTPFLR